MMKWPVSVLLFCLLGACQSKQTAPHKPVPTPADQFLSLFSELTTDTIWIETGNVEEEVELAGYWGQKLDSTWYAFIDAPDVMRFVNGDDSNLHACFRFRIDEQTEGLIFREPYEYWDNAIRIYLFDRQIGKTVKSLEAAIEWGDAGDSHSLGTLLCRSPEGWTAYQFETLCSPEDEEDLDSITCEDSSFVYKIGAGGFQELERKATDTTLAYPMIRRFSKF